MRSTHFFLLFLHLLVLSWTQAFPWRIPTRNPDPESFELQDMTTNPTPASTPTPTPTPTPTSNQKWTDRVKDSLGKVIPSLRKPSPIPDELIPIRLRRLNVHHSCEQEDAKRINLAFSQALNVSINAMSTIDWALANFTISKDENEKRRISSPVEIMAGDRLIRQMNPNVPIKATKLQRLRGTFILQYFQRLRLLTTGRVGIYDEVAYEETHTEKQPLVARCGVDFLHDKDPNGNTKPPSELDENPDGNTSPPNNDENPQDNTSPPNQEDGFHYYWDTEAERWVRMRRPKCDSTPGFVRLGVGNSPDELVICPLGLDLLRKTAFLNEIKKNKSASKGWFIDKLAVSPPAWIHHALLQTLEKPINNLVVRDGLVGDGWEGIRTLALKRSELWMRNAGTIHYIALSWYMSPWNWGPGVATDPSEKKPKILPTNPTNRDLDVGYRRVLDKNQPPVDPTAGRRKSVDF